MRSWAIELHFMSLGGMMKGITVWITQVEPRNTATKKVGASGFPHWERMDFSSSAWIMQRPASADTYNVAPRVEGRERNSAIMYLWRRLSDSSPRSFTTERVAGGARTTKAIPPTIPQSPI